MSMHLWDERAAAKTVCGTLLPVGGERCTRDGEEVDCPACLERMADRVEGAIGCNHKPWGLRDPIMTCTKCGEVVVEGDES